MKKIPSYLFATLCCGLALVATSNAATLVTYYDFEGGTSAIQRSDKAVLGGTADNLTAAGTVSFLPNQVVSVDKPATTVAVLTADNNGLFAASSADTTMSGSFSIALWIKYDKAISLQENFNTVINKRNDDNPSAVPDNSSNYWMGQGEISAPNDSFRASFDDSITGANISAPAQYSQNLYVETDWHHYAMVFDTDANTLKLYIDGLLVAGTTVFDEPLTDTTANFSIGRRASSTTDFDGWVDDVRLYKGVLTDQEVYSLAVPEPCTLALAALAGMAMIGLRRRK